MPKKRFKFELMLASHAFEPVFSAVVAQLVVLLALSTTVRICTVAALLIVFSEDIALYTTFSPSSARAWLFC